MKVTDSGKLKHRQLCFEDYLQRVSAEQGEYAEVCAPPRMTETDNTNNFGSAVYRTVRTVLWEVGWSINDQPPTRLDKPPPNLENLLPLGS
ncbi:MAG: hypothetical protein QMC95_02705 [Desulfitobacteriaceae bacterium]|nr:hypothetical protein [Desulfitobacteriaceae bacterium]MDI6913114.1 hypothetical protein [Desulfitobacteriaceae bacterium]